MRRDFLTAAPEMVLFDWLSHRIGLAWSVDFKAIGRVVDGKLVGVVGFNNHTGTSCQMHMAGEGKHWISPVLLRTAFWMPFVEWNYQVVFGSVPSGNDAALAIDLKLGFQKLDTIRGAHPDGALHLLMMRREDCRWIVRRKRGQEVSTRSTGHEPAGLHQRDAGEPGAGHAGRAERLGA